MHYTYSYLPAILIKLQQCIRNKNATPGGVGNKVVSSMVFPMSNAPKHWAIKEVFTKRLITNWSFRFNANNTKAQTRSPHTLCHGSRLSHNHSLFTKRTARIRNFLEPPSTVDRAGWRGGRLGSLSVSLEKKNFHSIKLKLGMWLRFKKIRHNSVVPYCDVLDLKF